MELFCVYEHVSPSGKRYFGITSQSPERRWRADGSGYRQNPHFMNAIKKYGWENFAHNVIQDGLTKEEACELEQELILRFGTNRMDAGYNRSYGGEHGKLGPESRKQISESVKHLWNDPEYRRHMSEAHKGQAHYGRVYTEETRKKIGETVRKRCEDPEYRARLSESAKRRAQKPGEAERRSARSRKAWQNDESREKMLNALMGNKRRARKVICIETGEIFASVSEAAQSIGNTRESVGRVCRGLSRTAGKMHWRFVDEG